ncbi:uncharacterized protein LOC129581958 [Paramacrobiotus metropolitanus]|uniref:uncharacterized protein LOC129581958 n=1 Tax=Paramacrobiotus metropolitanus TaxID=2943436 RepID=UPI002445FEF3|nr:uncharacterized protein LOC129581958 [Paramacrobiotus metropolitanus]
MLLVVLVLLPFAFGQTSDDIDRTADHITAVNPLGNPYPNDTRLHILNGELRENETLNGTLNLCSNGSNLERIDLAITSNNDSAVKSDEMPRRMKISYFRGYKSLVFYARAEDLWIMKFRDFLDLPKFMGVHRIALPQTNRSVSEVEEALAEEGKANVKIHLAAFEPAVAIYRYNGSFSTLTVLPFSFVPAIKDKVFARTLPLNKLGDFPERYYKFDRHFSDVLLGVKSGIKALLSRPFTRAFSFRMYLDRPMSIQLLPELEKLMWERLHANTTKDSIGFPQVRLWNLDPDELSVDFFIFFVSGVWDLLAHLDSRLSYAKVIYNRLNGITLDKRRSDADSGMDVYTLSSEPPLDGAQQKASVLRACQEETFMIPPSHCPVTGVLVLYVQSTMVHYLRISLLDENDGYVEKTLNSDQILNAVRQAFAEANPITIDNITLTISLSGREDDMQTVDGNDVSKFSFSLSYSKIDTGFRWKLWRYPTKEVINKFLQTADARLVDTWILPVPVSFDNLYLAS